MFDNRFFVGIIEGLVFRGILIGMALVVGILILIMGGWYLFNHAFSLCNLLDAIEY